MLRSKLKYTFLLDPQSAVEQNYDRKNFSVSQRLQFQIDNLVILVNQSATFVRSKKLITYHYGSICLIDFILRTPYWAQAVIWYKSKNLTHV